MSKIKIKETELYQLYDRALADFKDNANKGLSSKEFIAKCYLDAAISLLQTKGIEIELEYRHEDIYKAETLD